MGLRRGASTRAAAGTRGAALAGSDESGDGRGGSGENGDVKQQTSDAVNTCLIIITVCATDNNYVMSSIRP